MITALAFVVAAGAGALARAEAGRRWNQHEGLAAGTLIVNVTGSFLLGLLVTTAPPVVTVLGVAGLGTYTTFSSFARDTAALIEQKRVALAATYVGVTLTLGIAAAAVGVALAGWSLRGAQVARRGADSYRTEHMTRQSDPAPPIGPRGRCSIAQIDRCHQDSASAAPNVRPQRSRYISGWRDALRPLDLHIRR